MPKRPTYDEKLQRILRVAAEIFADKGYHQASIRDIARATEISLSGLYYYFSSKEELLFLIQDHAFGTLLERLDSQLAEVTDPVLKLRLLMENHLRFFADNMAEMKVLSHEADSLSGEYRRQVNAKKRRLTDTAATVLAQIDPDGRIDRRVATFALFGMMNWLYNWYRSGKDLPAEALAEHMSRLFLAGFLGDGTDLPAPETTSGDDDDTRMWKGSE